MLVYVRKYLKILLQVFYECGFGFGIQVAGQEKRFFVSGGKVFYKHAFPVQLFVRRPRLGQPE